MWHGMAFELMSIPMPFLNFATVLLGRVSIYTGICHYTDKITVSHLFWCALLLLIISSFSPSLFFVEFFGVFFFFLSCAVENISFRYSVWYGRVDMVCVRLIVYTIHLSIIYIKYEETPVVAFLQCVWLFNFCSAFFLKNRWYKCGRSSQAKQTQWCVCVYLCIYRSYSESLSLISSRILSTLAVWGSICLCIHFVFT